MPGTDPTVELDARFSSPGAQARPWSEVTATMEAAEIFWLSTVRADGRPHVTPLPAMWVDDALHFCTGPEEQKARNIAANPRCVLTTGTNAYRTGLDVMVEGEAVRVTDQPLLERLAHTWEDKIDWHFDVVDGAFRDPNNPGNVAHVFRVAPTKVLAFGKGEPFSQTRYRF